MCIRDRFNDRIGRRVDISDLILIKSDTCTERRASILQKPKTLHGTQIAISNTQITLNTEE